MPADNLGVPERAALLALMAEAREISNPELERLAGFRLSGAALRKLHARRLVESRRATNLKGNPFAHTLTDDGWAWCTKELAAGRPGRAGTAGGALYALLAGLHRYLARSHLQLSDLFRPDDGAAPAPPPPAAQPPAALALPDRIRLAYRKLAKDPQALVSLAGLRPLLGEARREAVDAALRQMSRAREVNLVPQGNQKILSQADRHAAVRIGEEDCHLISVATP